MERVVGANWSIPILLYAEVHNLFLVLADFVLLQQIGAFAVVN
jgi:hypothetical protein